MNHSVVLPQVAVGIALMSLAATAIAADALPPSNPFAVASTLPYRYPPFDRIKDEHYRPAFEAGMAEQLREVDAIVRQRSVPTFENTVVALERAGVLLRRVNDTFSNLAGTFTNDAMRALEKEMSPRLAAQSDAIRLNPELFSRIDALHQKRDQLGLDAESKRLLERYHQDFVRAGARLAPADQARLKAMNQEIAGLQTTFAQNIQKESNARMIVVDTRAELAGLPDNEIAAAEAAAKEEGKPGKFVLRLLNTSGQPSLDALQNRALRERIQRASVSRSQSGDYDNRPIVARLALLRAQRAELLGFPTHAAYQIDDQTAGTVERVNKLLAELAPPAVANARKEAADIQRVIDREKGGFEVAPWDWDFYAEKVRSERYAFDESQLKPYLELNRVLVDGVFYAAGRLYGLTFKERKDLPVYEPSVRVFEVFEADGKPLALFIADNFARPSKRGGAWMNSYVAQSKLFGTKPVIANHLNIPPPPPGEPALLTWDNVITLFHEFGHALHGMFSNVQYPRFSGTQVPRDFVEFPSQVNEMWATWPEVFRNFARHHRTGEPMPAALLEKVLASGRFNQGFRTTEYLAASLLDQAWHQLKAAEVPGSDGVMAFEAAALKRAGVDFAPVPPRYRSTYFSHVFSLSYSAGYYSYIWAEVLDADTVEWFRQNGGLTRANGDRFRTRLLSRGGSVDAMALFRDFAGREPRIQPLLERRGLAPAAAKGD